MQKPKMICHGGVSPRTSDIQARRRVTVRATKVGYRILRKGGSALDAVTEAITVMEDDPLLNAGTGSFVQMDGISRMDACVMDSELNVGAVIQISDVKNPIQVARRILDQKIHSILMGDLASDFARKEGFGIYDPRTQEKLEIWLKYRKKYAKYKDYELVHCISEEVGKQKMLGTVGAVALDQKGRIAAGTSTGGLRLDLPGRVGDVPLVGCGTYANVHSGVSCTGIGEKIIKVVLAKTVADLVETGLSAQKASETAIERISAVGGKAGLICIDNRGGFGAAFNTPVMNYHKEG